MAKDKPGKANTAMEKLVAGALGVPGKRVPIVPGNTSTRKVIGTTGLSEAEVYSRLSDATS